MGETTQFSDQLKDLAELLVTPERFGKAAVAAVVVPLPETARLYDFPAPAGDSAA